jgi:hypothetical protein
MLISMPTGTSTIFGVFQAILARSSFSRTDSILGHKLARNEKFASEIFFKLVLISYRLCCTAKGIHVFVRGALTRMLASVRRHQARSERTYEMLPKFMTEATSNREYRV